MKVFAHTHERQTIFDRMKCDVLLHIFIDSMDQLVREHGLAVRLIP